MQNGFRLQPSQPRRILRVSYWKKIGYSKTALSSKLS